MASEKLQPHSPLPKIYVEQFSQSLNKQPGDQLHQNAFEIIDFQDFLNSPDESPSFVYVPDNTPPASPQKRTSPVCYKSYEHQRTRNHQHRQLCISHCLKKIRSRQQPQTLTISVELIDGKVKCQLQGHRSAVHFTTLKSQDEEKTEETTTVVTECTATEDITQTYNTDQMFLLTAGPEGVGRLTLLK